MNFDTGLVISSVPALSSSMCLIGQLKVEKATTCDVVYVLLHGSMNAKVTHRRQGCNDVSTLEQAEILC